jgi:hypothetical protein
MFVIKLLGWNLPLISMFNGISIDEVEMED